MSFLEDEGEVKLRELRGNLPPTHRIEKQLEKKITLLFFCLFLHQLERVMKDLEL